MLDNLRRFRNAGGARRRAANEYYKQHALKKNSTSQSQMEEPKELQGIGKQVQSDCNAKQWEMSYKLYQLMSLSMSCIIQEIDKRKENENRINYELMGFSYDDEKMERTTRSVKYLQGDLAKEKPPPLPMRSIPWTAGFLILTEKDAETLEKVQVHVGTSMKRCHKWLKKERMDFEYLQQVQEELLLMKSSRKQIQGTQELNHVMKSLGDRIQHGCNNRADEQKIFHEIKKIPESIEIYTAPTQPDLNGYHLHFRDWGGQRRRAATKYYKQHALKLALDDIEEIEKNQKGRTARVRRLKVDRDQVRKNVRCMERLLEKVYTKRKKVYKCACKHEQQKEESSYNGYQLLMENVKELARKGDAGGLMQFFDMQSRMEESKECNVKEREMSNKNADKPYEIEESFYVCYH